MTRTISAALAIVVSAAPAWADMKMTQTVSGKALGIDGSSLSTTYIKGNKMRADVVVKDVTRTTIYDVDAHKMYIFDSKKKEADVWDMAAFAQEIGSTMQVDGMTASIKPNGQTKQVAGKTAAGYDMAITMPATMGADKNGQGGMKMIANLSGPVWIVKGAPGTDDYLRFYKAASEKGFIFSDPRAAKGQPGQAKAMREMYNQLAATGGLPYEMEMNIKMGGEGPMAGLMSRMGNMTSTSTVQTVDTAPLDDALFAPPAGYKLSTKK
jgi:hypothetical protein